MLSRVSAISDFTRASLDYPTTVGFCGHSQRDALYSYCSWNLWPLRRFPLKIPTVVGFQDRGENNNNDLAEALKARRKDLDVTQQTLADFTNLTKNGISKIETAHSDVKISTLLKMAKILGFKVIIEIEP